MVTNLPAASDPAIDLAREALYRFLAAALSDPHGGRWLPVLDPESQRLAHEAARLLREEAGAAPGRLGLGELPPEALTLTPLCVELDQPPEALRAEHLRVFGLVPTKECPPHETEYHPTEEPFFRAQQMADVAGFYRAFGIEPAHVRPERPDHLALELEFMAVLLMKKRLALAGAAEDAGMAEGATVCDEAQHSFFRDHLAWWVPAFATGLRRRAGGGFYAALGQVLAALIPVERHRLGVDTPSVPARPSSTEGPEEPAGCAGCPAHG
jgi:TorA maturation chaperone TorD